MKRYIGNGFFPFNDDDDDDDVNERDKKESKKDEIVFDFEGLDKKPDYSSYNKEIDNIIDNFDDEVEIAKMSERLKMLDGRRKSMKRKSMRRKSMKRKSMRRKSMKRKSMRRKSMKRKSMRNKRK